MFDFPPDSDGEIGSETLTSSQSSMSCESCSSFSNFSFDALETQTKTTPSSSPENPSLKPHRSSDSAWEAIRSAVFRNKNGLNFRDFKLVRKIGSGDIGNVYLCRLRGLNNNGGEENPNCSYAMKVVDKEALALKKKLGRAETEKRILKMLDHPFLPTLYAEFEASHFACVVMEFCSGGDLHTLRHKQPGKRFSLSSARFYAAEVLVALEYLHMLGIIYRDLKPENILVRSDGHIMLSDFDLSLCSDAIPAVESPDSSPGPINLHQKLYTTKSPSSPSSSFFCFGNRSFRSRKVRTVTMNRQFVAEPVSARSCSFVGTHEYVSPEVASGKSHGNAVDWWALGVFIYELIYGHTPFAGDNNEMTLRNIVKKKLTFPTESPVSVSEVYARDLISGLLEKDPEKRLGSKRGAADVKTHPFFKGLNFALVRSYPPPGIPSLRPARTSSTSSACQDGKKYMSTAFDFF
ncbi:Protein kinase domain [Macleaya cordata]|uniref:non-specific serine/threonine protein kinase n=1 Tax=Macleaya cordata TaxID=56857 RepID=A0A200PMF9_MACCD|nr:Protein kinase domain [Macleaya cordata]